MLENQRLHILIKRYLRRTKVKKLLNTLYVTSTNRYLSLDGENVVILEDQEEIGRVPLHNLERAVPYKRAEERKHKDSA